VKINTEQGRAIRPAKQELERGVRELKGQLESWRDRLSDDHGCFEEIETEVNLKMREIADYVSAGLLSECAEDPSAAQVDEARQRAQEAGNALKAPTRNYPVKVILLCGLVLRLHVMFCPSDKRKCDQRGHGIEERSIGESDGANSGVHIELSQFGFGKGCSPGLQSEVARLVCLCPSMEQARKELARRGIDLNIKQVRRIAEQLGVGMLCVRKKLITQWKAGELPVGMELAGKRVAVAVDGGRVRFRVNTKKTRKGKRTCFETVWREPKVLIIYTLDEKGRKQAGSDYWIEGTFQGPDHVMELMAMHLYRLGAMYAHSVEFVSDGAPWIWNRLDWVGEKAGIDPSKVLKALDFWHASHHISLALEKLGLGAKERAPIYRELRKELRLGRWRAVIEGLEQRATELGVDADHEVYKETDFLRRHGEYGHLQYLKYKRRRVTLGSGAIESSIRRVINLRLKGNGIFWKEANAEAVMTMRAKLLSDQWEENVGLVREQWKVTRGGSYRWRAVNIREELKRDYFEEDDLSKKPEISGVSDSIP